jgi:transcription initiation factor IIE alpha subunit
MTLCSDGHDEVCYDGKECPVCKAIQDTKDADEEIKEMEKEIKELKEDIASYSIQ